MKDTTQEAKDPYFILKLLITVVLADTVFFGVLGAEGIVDYGGRIIVGAMVLTALLGIYFKSKEEAGDESMGFVWVAMIFIVLSMVGIVYYVWINEDKLLAKKHFIVFNYDTSERNITIEGKTLRVKPLTRQTVTLKGKSVHVNAIPYVRNGRYLVNASEHVCYKLKKLLLTTQAGSFSGMAVPLSLPEPYGVETIRARVYYENSDDVIVFPGETFYASRKEIRKNRYKAVVLTSCGL